MSSDMTFVQRLVNAVSLLVITLQSIGNDAVIFGISEPGRWAVWKVGLLASVPLLLIALGLANGWRQGHQPEAGARRMDGLLASWHIALLPISFLAVSLIFGNRLWSHHFSALVPLSYVVLFLAVHHLQVLTRISLPRWIGVVLMSGFIVGNMQQQHVFFDRLVTTGGNAYFSNAMNRMADDALSMPVETVHVFPEWGFGMPFALLTGNRRLYEADIGDATLQRLADAGSTLRLYYWKPETANSYRDKLLANGYRVSASGNYLQRDQRIAFYWMEASVSGSVR
jgi:hypothetical protein